MVLFSNMKHGKQKLSILFVRPPCDTQNLVLSKLSLGLDVFPLINHEFMKQGVFKVYPVSSPHAHYIHFLWQLFRKYLMPCTCIMWYSSLNFVALHCHMVGQLNLERVGCFPFDLWSWSKECSKRTLCELPSRPLHTFSFPKRSPLFANGESGNDKRSKYSFFSESLYDLRFYKTIFG